MGGDRVFALSRTGANPVPGSSHVRALPCDVSDASQVQSALSDVIASTGRIDVLVNNAGTIDPIGRIAEVDAEAWSKGLRANLEGAFYLIRYVLPPMLAARRGFILNLSSGAASAPLEGWSAYCAAKAGLAMLTRCVNEEYRAAGISCLALRPGLVDTDMQQTIRQLWVNAVSRIPKEQLASPAVVAQAVQWVLANGEAVDLDAELDIRDAEFRRKAGLGAT